ncbi:hypothetical protein GCM10009304_15270 [Pseudomonas matsuisoli]|uniref:DUF4398 domain-containing protein n=2 Tax=Pseudomonas matsuisoli TaxID=1515666 RepID=A0A917PT13_9PSED|nr:hypothetical protein GCM10009304_15270 [Pseudomonas matsuisoli]
MGCTSADPAPTAQMELSEQALAQAQTIVGDTPSVLLEAAVHKLVLAREKMAQRDFRAARMLAEQAELDARLAEVRVINEKQGLAITQLNRQIKSVRRELESLQ